MFLCFMSLVDKLKNFGRGLALAGAFYLPVAATQSGCISVRQGDTRATVWMGGAILETYENEKSNRVIRKEIGEYNGITGEVKTRVENYDSKGNLIKED